MRCGAGLLGRSNLGCSQFVYVYAQQHWKLGLEQNCNGASRVNIASENLVREKTHASTLVPSWSLQEDPPMDPGVLVPAEPGRIRDGGVKKTTYSRLSSRRTDGPYPHRINRRSTHPAGRWPGTRGQAESIGMHVR